MNKPLQVIICEDHNLTIDGLCVLLSAYPGFVLTGHANTSEELFELLEKVTPDILILDINLGNENGLTLIGQIKEKAPHIRVLILTMYDDPVLVSKAKELKADGYLTKSATSLEFIEALEGLKRNIFYESPAGIAKRVNGEKLRDAFIERMKLTKREVEIISLVSQGKSVKAISEQLNLSLFTIQTHKKNIMKKLKLKSAVELVHYAMRNNFV